MARPQHTHSLPHLEEAVIVLFCFIDDTYYRLNPEGRQALRDPQGALGLGGHNPRAVPATPRGGERTLLPARRRAVLLASVPGGGRAAPFLAQPAHEEAEALLGAPAPRDPPRSRRRSRDSDRRFDVAFGPPSQASRAVGGLRGSGVGEVGHFQRLRGEAPSALRH